MPDTWSTTQLIYGETLQEMASFCRSIILVLGDGPCQQCSCEGCEVEREEAKRLAREAGIQVNRLIDQAAALGCCPPMETSHGTEESHA